MKKKERLSFEEIERGYKKDFISKYKHKKRIVYTIAISLIYFAVSGIVANIIWIVNLLS